MPIRILPPLLANQIAAGEVVERPASVVKELVENSLDAGANRIDIELEKGGCALIRIRDNGGGITKDELVLALQRHATSKVSSLDDLEAICSLGFRGEALASISSVSRLTLTSRTPEQTEAWQACAEGRDMAVQVRPAAHPVGTTVEVADLFFNTPARRRFLRSEKTEFGHIDDWLRRLALSRFDVSLTLRHNGKLIRQYRPCADEQSARARRVAAVCGPHFLEQAIHLDSEHLGLRLHGWIPLPAAAGAPTLATPYFYVNGRVMRDRLITHAIRQGYLEALGTDCAPDFLLYLDLDPRQVDVNVHPAKHEVRFHESRRVHDFVVSVVRDALSQGLAGAVGGGQPMTAAELLRGETGTPLSLQERGGSYPGLGAHQHRYQQHAESASGCPVSGDAATGHAHGTSARGGYTPAGQPPRGHAVAAPSRAARQGLNALMTTVPLTTTDGGATAPAMQEGLPADAAPAGWRWLAAPAPQVVLFGDDQRCLLVHVGKLLRRWHAERLLADWQGEGLTSQPLLMPVSLALEALPLAWLNATPALWQQLGVQWRAGSRSGQVVLLRVPVALRHTDLAQAFPQLLTKVHTLLDDAATLATPAVTSLCEHLAHYLVPETLQPAHLQPMWRALGSDGLRWLTSPDWSRPLDLTSTLQELLND